MHSLIWWSLGLSLLINLILFLIAFNLKSDKLTDISYALSFLALAIYALLKTTGPNVYSYIVFAMVVVWAFRIGGFLLNRVLKVGKDRRFDDMRDNFVRFGKFWLGQAIAAWILMIPAEYAITKASKLAVLVYVGVVIYIIGLFAESIADWQKFNFHERKNKKHPWIDEGIWSLSRHPNYFGEIAVWIGIYVASFMALNTPQRLIGLLSPLFITILLLFVMVYRF